MSEDDAYEIVWFVPGGGPVPPVDAAKLTQAANELNQQIVKAMRRTVTCERLGDACCGEIEGER